MDCRRQERQYADEVLSAVNSVAKEPIYFELLHLACKDMGVINVCTEKRKDDAAFPVDRREYKKRFGWMIRSRFKKEVNRWKIK
ncbi:MAG: hypothetical protein PHS97_03000 [Oscillospiraceae bacterium]|nr:hypothetical protein [Oscillospiraceae bacterium]